MGEERILRKFSRFKLTLRVLPRAIVYIWKYVIHELLEWDYVTVWNGNTPDNCSKFKSTPCIVPDPKLVLIVL